MKKAAVIGALGLLASTLFAQGLNTGGQTKDDWEEINFEFNSSILSDGYPSLLRLAELLSQHRDYRVKVTGHTDYVGSAQYNDRLALHRAEAVKEFLVKYGAGQDQVTTSGDGKRAPEVDNRTKEGRFMNRRVVLTVSNASGQVIKEGGVGDILKALQDILASQKRQEECCAQILKRLDKLDDILAALKNLQGENDKLQGELNDLRNQHNALRDQVAGLPKPLSSQETQNIAHTEAMGAVDEAQKRNKKFSIVGVNIGPAFGPGRNGSDFTASGRAQFFSPFGGDGHAAVQAQGEFLYYPDRKEGQFDIGLLDRWKAIQFGGFASFKYLEMKQYQTGGALGQADFLLDYVFKGGRVGAFVTRGFKNYAILNSVTLAPGAYLQTFARVVNQQGINFLFGTWGNAFLSGDVAYLQLRQTHDARPGASLKLTQPFAEHFAFTAEARYNTSYISPHGSGEVVVGLEMGNYIHPSEYARTTSPVPMDIPRIRYELGTRRVGASPPIADAGPPQNVQPNTLVTLNGCNSYDPLGETLTYTWLQTSGTPVSLGNPASCNPTFTANSGTYTFRLTVTNTDHLSATASTSVSVASPTQVQITSFTASPATITSGQCATLSWSVQNATSVAITPGVGNVDPRTGSVSVCPTATTTYTLTANNANGPMSVTTVVTVTAATASGTPQIVRFEASPMNIQPGQSSTLSWATNGASSVTITPGPGNVPLNGSTVVTPTQTTTYTLTATSSDGKSVTTPVTVIVAPGQIPQIVAFTANPPVISQGQSTKLCWQVTGSTNIAIAPGVGSNLNTNDCATVSPSQTTTYTLTATNATGQIQANVTVTVGATQILSFTSDPQFSLKAGSPVTLAWQTTNAQSVVIIANSIQPQTLPANGTVVVNPEVTTAYTLTAYGPSGQTVSVTITVVVR